MNRFSSMTATVVAGAAVGLAAMFWWPLFRGAGFVGGDVYSYYLPQKVVYAEHLKRGALPLWNDRAGHGYPIVGESQTGPFYPFHLVFYRLLGVNAAYNANHLVHYVLAFVFTWLYARAIGLSRWAAALSAMVFTYAWFPPRCCWEWAILGGAWMPAAFWCAERYLAARQARFAFGLCAVLAAQLLAGHFNLAFLTLVSLVPYVAMRLVFADAALSKPSDRRPFVCAGVLSAAVVGAYLLSAAQILPTWELKQHSQRRVPGPNHQLAHGSIPVGYLSQVIAPWEWYSLFVNRDQELKKWQAALGAATNQVEAHLYFGLIPLVLALCELVAVVRYRDRLGMIWLVIAAGALLYTTGWCLVVTRYIPGFNFFQGPGRYGVIATLGVGVLAGKSLDRFRATGSLVRSLGVLVAFCAVMWTGLTLTSQSAQLTENTGSGNRFTCGSLSITGDVVTAAFLFGFVVLVLAVIAQNLNRGARPWPAADLGRWTIIASVLAVTAFDLWMVSRVVTYSEMIDDPPINHLAESAIRRICADSRETSRLLAPGANLPSAVVAATPVYLTFGPAEYADPARTMPTESTARQLAWLRRAGVTGVLAYDPQDVKDWTVRLVWRGFDRLLNPAWGRYREPLYLYAISGSRGRVAWEAPAPGYMARVVASQSNRVEIEALSPGGGRLILTDLMYPGWTVAVDGAAAVAQTAEGMFRAVDLAAGPHTVVWTYRPRIVYWGLIVSGVAFATLCACLVFLFVRRGRWSPDKARPR